MVKATTVEAGEPFTHSLGGLELAVVMIDDFDKLSRVGVEVRGHSVVIASGIDTKGVDGTGPFGRSLASGADRWFKCSPEGID